MADWEFFLPYVLGLLLIQLVLSIILIVILVKYPIILYKGWKRYLIFSCGFTKKKIKVSDNFEFSYLERGNAKDCEVSLLLVHGFTSDKESWCFMGKNIPKRVHIVALDLPGHGETTRKEKDDVSIESLANRVEQFAEAVGLNKRKYHIAGTSLGGFIVGIHASLFPKNLASALLICPAGINSPIKSDMLKAFEEDEKILLLPKTTEEFIKMINFLVFKPVKFPKFIVAGIMQARLKAQDFYYRMLEGFMDESKRYLLQDKLKEIQVQMLIVWGKHDRALHVSSTDTIKKILPDVQIDILNDCGHSISLERPRKLASIITRFLEQ